MYEQEVGQFQAKRDKVAEGEASELKHFVGYSTLCTSRG